MHIEYPKKLHHRDGSRRRVGSVEEQWGLEIQGGWGESPAGPFSKTPSELAPEEPPSADQDPEVGPNADQDPDSELQAAVEGRRGPGRPRKQPEE